MTASLRPYDEALLRRAFAIGLMVLARPRMGFVGRRNSCRSLARRAALTGSGTLTASPCYSLVTGRSAKARLPSDRVINGVS
jgi:hypothetical protein